MNCAQPVAQRTDQQNRPVLDRTAEWFVLKFGPPRFRVFVGLLFLPYTAMVLAYAVIGAMLAPGIDWNRVGARSPSAPPLADGAHSFFSHDPVACSPRS